MRIMSRSQASLPGVPGAIGHRSLSSWAGIRVHHTGGAFSAWRSIHDWQTSGRPPGDRLAYIGYSFGISDGVVWTLRGWDHHPAHDFINTHIGVVFGGSFGSRLPSAADLDAFAWFVGEAERRIGKALPISTHREVGQTSCPGDALHRWVKQELPSRLEDDMPLDKDDVKKIWRTDGIVEKPVGYPDSDNKYWMPASVLRSTQYWSRRGAKRLDNYSDEILAGQAAILARLDGKDDGATRAAIRDELTTHRAALVAALGEDLAAAVADELVDLPAEQVEAAVGRALARTRLTVQPAGDEDDD